MLMNYFISLIKRRNHNINVLMTHENNWHTAFNVHMFRSDV